MLHYNKNLSQYSRSLRKNMTDAEIKLWSQLRLKQLKGYQFYRQRIIGNYILDFYCPRSKLVIEVDGGQHFEDGKEKADQARDHYLKNQGLRILRFTDTEVLQNIEGVVETILSILDNS